MRKKIIAAVTAGVLALAGVVTLVAWARNADQRAFEGADLVSVVQLTADAPAGTKADALSAKVVELPSKAVPDGAVTKLSEVSGLVATTPLEEGEVLLRSRMATPGERASGGVDVPKGMQEISFNVEGQRLVGGAVKAGDKVGVFGSFKPDDSKVPDWTNLVAHDVLVTKVQNGAAQDAALVATVTVAVRTELAEKIVFTMEFGKIWLSLQNADTERSGEKVIEGSDLR